MAFAALASLVHTIDLILNYHQDSISPQVKNQFISIHEYTIFFQVFLEHFPDKASSFEATIMAVTHVAEDIIEFFMSEYIYEPRCASLKSSVGQSKSRFKYQPKGKHEYPLHDFPHKASSLVGRIWEIINVAVIIKSLFSRQIYESCYASLQSKFKYQPKGQYEHLRYDFHALKKAKEDIQSIAEIVIKIKKSITVKDVQLGDSTAVSSSSRVAPFHKDSMVGFDGDVMEIKSQLCGESSKREVIPIVGMGGIGKTTLTRSVYDDPLTVGHFDFRAWATISQNYSVREIVSGFPGSMNLLDAKDYSMEGHKVYKYLKGRRYLIVLDDIWSVKAWDDLKMMFPDDGNGSRIILTTRLLDVATYAGSSCFVHNMHLMDVDQSWNLLRQKVFEQDPCPLELEFSGKAIAKRCSGLPLAIVVISGILSSVDQTEATWWNIAENIKFAISANYWQFNKILSLSYTHLPHHLRPCFLYMGGYPEDFEMNVSKIIKLWVAEGFLKPKQSKSFEETAEEYLEDLVKRSLFLVTKRKSNGRIKSFSMHDLMREMCIRIAQEENFILYDQWEKQVEDLEEEEQENDEEEVGVEVAEVEEKQQEDDDEEEVEEEEQEDEEEEEVVEEEEQQEDDDDDDDEEEEEVEKEEEEEEVEEEQQEDDDEEEVEELEEEDGRIKIPRRVRISYHHLDFVGNVYGSTIRTVIYKWHGSEGAPRSFRYFRLLRILDLSDSYSIDGTSLLRSLPAEVFELFHLRYLAVNFRLPIPAAISNLQNLQTLLFRPSRFYQGSFCFVQLPVDIWRMPQLRHLVGFFSLLPIREGASVALENLHTLSLARNFICTPKILKMIPNLKKLGISFKGREYADEIYEEDYELHNLINLQQLENLKLMICPGFRPCPEKVNPAFPRSLKKLTLSGWGLLSWKDMKIVGSLPKLEVLKLRDFACSGFTWETTEGEFSQLRFLLIDNSELENWITESSHFPRLKCLVLRRCWHLSEIPDCIGEISTLELIEVDDRNKSLVDSAIKIQDDQQSYGNDALNVYFVKS